MFGGPFEMVSTATGETFTEADLQGTPTLMFFGYTYCPDVCPLTLAETTAWKEQLGLDADDLNIVFVTVDPERDTVETVRTYLSNFGEDVFGLVGNEAQTDQIKRSYGVFSEKVEAEGSTEYLVNHTSSVYMIDADGKFFGTIAYMEDSNTAMDKIRRLTGA
nr:SCO family protein [Pelagibacterium xiamenense]